MKIQLHNIAIKTNATTEITKAYAAYEAEILAAVHGAESVHDLGPHGDFEIAGIEQEVGRLCALYGRGRLESLYGLLLKGLAEDIKAAVVPERRTTAK